MSNTRFFSKFEKVEIPNVPVFEYLFSRIKEYEPEAVAFHDAPTGFQLTYQNLLQFTKVVAYNLQEKINFGVEGEITDNVMAILLPNHPLYFCLFHGVNVAGGCNTTMNPLYTPEEIQKQLLDSGSVAITTLPMFLDKVLKALEGTKVKHVLLLQPEPSNKEYEGVPEGVQILDFKSTLLAPPASNNGMRLKRQPTINPKESICVLPYSSGTSGVAKGVMLTHENILANLFQLTPVEPIKSSDRLVGLLPFFHIYGMVLLLFKCVEVGAYCVVLPRFEMEPFLKVVQDHKLTRLYLVPPIILGLAKHPVVEKYDLSSVKVMLSGAAPLTAELVHIAKQRFPNIVFKQGYGLTETSPVITVEEDENPIPGSSGYLLPNIELRLADVSSGEEVGVGKEGEIQIRGPNVMKGYLGKPEETAKCMSEDGFFKTGDVGYISEEGRLFVVDRVKELIKYKGLQVPPAELEGLLVKNPHIADCAVIGVPDQEAGEIPKAFVVKKPNAPAEFGAEDVMSFVAEHVAPYKKIRLVEFVDAIPKTTSGKILRRELRERERKKQIETQAKNLQ